MSWTPSTDRRLPGGRPPPIGEMLVTARSIDEYLAMFDLTIDGLLGSRVLDCPGGAAGFIAGLTASGIDAVAADPVYRIDPGVLAAHARAEVERGNAYVRANVDRYVWSYFSDPDAHQHERSQAADLFVAHRALAPERYVAAALPDLPFPDDSFELALSSHLLFSYDDRLGLDFHVAAAHELLRVADEVRVFPTLAMDFERSALLPDVMTALAADGAHVTTRTTAYEFQRGGGEMLVIQRPPA